MSKQVHTHRLDISIVLAAIAVAAALPVIAALARENGSGTNMTSGDASRLVAAVSTPSVATGTPYRTPYKTGDPAHAASMLIVGSLLIGLGTLVRRAA